MPKGVYERTPEQKAILRDRIVNCARKLTPEQKAAAGERLRAAQIAHPERFREARQRNMTAAAYIRAARAILRNCPLDAKPGNTFKSGNRQLIVIDPSPVKVGDALWKQEFKQVVTHHIFGRKITIQGIARIVWHYQPTNDTVLNSPVLENVITSELENLPDSDTPGI